MFVDDGIGLEYISILKLSHTKKGLASQLTRIICKVCAFNVNPVLIPLPGGSLEFNEIPFTPGGVDGDSQLSIPDAICQLPRRWHTRGCRAETAAHGVKALMQQKYLDRLPLYTQFTIFCRKDSDFFAERMRLYEKSPKR